MGKEMQMIHDESLVALGDENRIGHPLSVNPYQEDPQTNIR
jgi:hypothetical protein